MKGTQKTEKKRQNRQWRKAFIAALRNTGNVRASAQAAGVTRTTVYDARQLKNKTGEVSDSAKKFATQWDEALEDAADIIEAEAFRRAIRGVERRKPIFYQGQKCGEEVIQEYSDGLLTLLLKGNRPEKYRERHDVTSKGEPLIDREQIKLAARQAVNDAMRELGLPLEQAAEKAAKYFGVAVSDLIQ